MSLKQISIFIIDFLKQRSRSWDKGLLNCAFLLLLFGFFLTLTASPGSALREHMLDPYHYIKRQLPFILMAIPLMLGVGLLSLKFIRALSVVGLLAVTGLMFITLMLPEIKGSHRWLSLGGITIQPSEFMKPFFCVISAWCLAKARFFYHAHTLFWAWGIFAILVTLLILQPDFGMCLTIGVIFMAQLCLYGIGLKWIILLGFSALGGGFMAYQFLPHVHLRIDKFLKIDDQLSGQVKSSLRAIQGTGLFGKGPGEGIVKGQIPDAHTDFITAVSAEEFGFLLTAFLIGIFIFIVVRGCALIKKQTNFFSLLAIGGLITQIAFQAIVNMGATVNVLPTKGMTLPFISCGGSSTCSMAITFGFLLALSHYHQRGKGYE